MEIVPIESAYPGFGELIVSTFVGNKWIKRILKISGEELIDLQKWIWSILNCGA